MYFIISASIFITMMTFLLYARGLLFFEPYFAFQIYGDLVLSFVLIVVVSGLTGLVSSITLYQILMQKASAKRAGSGMFGSLIGIGTSICTSCTQIGFTVISLLGATGAAALSFISHYEIPLRIISIALLTLSYFLLTKNITTKCKI